MWSSIIVASPAMAGVTFTFDADVHGRTATSGELPAGHGSHTVLDLYLANDSGDDLRLLNVYDINISLSQGSFIHNDADPSGNWSAAWSSLGGNVAIDSFVTMGAMSGSDPFFATLDPNFDGAIAGSVTTDAGWYNNDPFNGQGNVAAGDRVMIGRFVVMNDFATETTFSVSGNLSYNHQYPGVHFDGDAQVFTLPSVVPGPVGAFAFAAFGLAGRRRRR